MATHEREITEPVDLCTPDGRRLNPAATGWSRHPTLTANLRGSWGRNKRWDYWAILAGDLAIAVTYADVDYLGMASIWWCDLATGRSGGRDNNIPGAFGIDLPERPGTAPLRWSNRRGGVALVDDDGGLTIDATWREPDGTSASLTARIEQPPGHESLNVVIPWSETRFQFTSKHQARPAHGVLTVGDDERRFGRPADNHATDATDDTGADEAWGVLDVGRGRWPYRNVWNWGGGAGHGSSDDGAGDHVVGLQFGGKWTEGTGFTENGVIVDGRLTKVGDELEWGYDWDQPLRPWTVRAPDGSIDVTLHPRYDRHSRVETGVMGMEVHQVFGHWSGTVRDDDGVTYGFDRLQGFAEEARNRW